jgi:nucleoside-diphosphate-sugar epimerase
MDAALPDTISNVDVLDDWLSRPSPACIAALARFPGDIVVLGVAGKMGPTLARMTVRATEAAGVKRRVIGVARFSDPDVLRRLETWGVETITADLLDGNQLTNLPDAPLVVYLAGRKFGSTGQESLTWAMNVWLPGLVGERYRHSRIVALSTGNVYGNVPVSSGGATESAPRNPVGEYAMSCLGRERMFEHVSATYGTRVALIRLNYACELRYGVLVDLALKVWTGQPIDLTMGHFNVLWQADANALALAAFEACASPASIVNVTGPEILSIRDVCERFGQLFGREPQFVGEPARDALLNNATGALARWGSPRVPPDVLMMWVADWIRRDGPLLNKPTHFEVRDGKF